MGDQYQPQGDLESAQRAAAAHTTAAQDVEAFLRRLPPTPGPEDVTEYAALITREELLRGERQSAIEAVGLQVPSVEA